jgi:hypothetical protein
MEEKIQKILNEKFENEVQFDVTNATSSSVFINLFNTSDLSVIPNSPNYINPPNSVIGNIGAIAPISIIVLSNNGLIYAGDGSSNILIINPATNLVVGLIPLGLTGVTFLTYNPINNTIYVCTTTNTLIVIDCNTNTIITTILLPSTPFQSAFNSQQNTLYVTSTLILFVIDCNTNTIITSITLSCNSIQYNSTNNLIYTTDTISSAISIIDCFSNTTTGIIILNFPSTMFYVSLTNILYVGNNLGTELGVIDCSTNTLLSSVPIPVITGVLGFACIDDFFVNNTNVYFGTSLGYTIVISTKTNSIIDFFVVDAFSPIETSVFLSSTNEIYFACPVSATLTIITTTGIATNPFFISGSSNYNAFVNNLNSEPIFIQMFRLITENQQQLNNQLQITTIDSNGNQTFTPYFPINNVDVMQNSQNISDVSFDNMVFDGRTYINNYELNPFETISYIIYYKQLDSTTATITFPIFFKPKVQLKEYIKKDYENYNIEV